MGSIQKVKNKGGIRWRAFAWVGNERDSARFDTKAEAAAWVLRREAELARDGRLIGGHSVGDALGRYRDEVSATRKGERAESVRINRMMRDPIAALPLQGLRLEDGEAYRDRRLEQIKPNSVIREMTVLKAAVKRAVRWRWIETYPWTDLEPPRAGRARTRIYTDAEISAIAEAAHVADGGPAVTRMQEAGIAFLIALETAMRQSEIVSLEWADVDLERRVAHLNDSKNGDTRDVPLTSAAVELIRRLPSDRARLFKSSAGVVSTLFRRIRLAAGVEGATFHDARRYATVALSRKLDVLELARVTGHRDLKMLLVYYQRDAAELARKLG